jgi:hypothetical protein
VDQLVTARIAQLVVDLRRHEVGIGGSRRAAFERHDLQARGRELLGNDAAGPPQADDSDINRFQLCGHTLLPMESAPLQSKS